MSPTQKPQWATSGPTSDIVGTGWGAGHDWQRGETAPWKVTPYRCRACGASFAHAYDGAPSIFKAMHQAGVPNECPRKEPRP